MRKILIQTVPLLCVASLLFAAAACSGLDALDVVGKEAVSSFGAMLDAAADGVAPDEANGGWSLTAPDGAARFIWSEDYSKSPLHDVMLELDAQPFIDAGLDTGKLPEGVIFYGHMLMAGRKLGDDELAYSGDPTPLASFEQLAGKYRAAVGYHAALGHYNIDLGGGNMFEWAKDMAANDKDIVFVLDPQPFMDAGTDVSAVEGWAFAKVSVDVDGKPAEVDKLLKPFDLK
ncbi:MAG: hypothetical protein LBL26_01160 [Peptococcaceae bacterium]|jgi:hypothetical protein|nr:hypothetical protein [Peptococcaceae bacterium]